MARRPAPVAGATARQVLLQRAILTHLILGRTEDDVIARLSDRKVGLEYPEGSKVHATRAEVDAALVALGTRYRVLHDDPDAIERLVAGAGGQLARIAMRAEKDKNYPAAIAAIRARVQLLAARAPRYGHLLGPAGVRDTDRAAEGEDVAARTARKFASMSDAELDAHVREIEARAAMLRPDPDPDGNREP